MTNILDLPDLVLRTIFSLLSLVDLLHLDEVTPLWSQLQQTICLTRKSVTIFIGQNATELVENSHFKIPFIEELKTAVQQDDTSWNRVELINSGDLQCANKIGDLLSHVSTVCISFMDNVEPAQNTQSKVLNQMTDLLQKCCVNLKSLKLYVRLSSNENTDLVEHNLPKLLKVINFECPSLRHLTFELTSPIYYQVPEVARQWPILAQLNEFYLNFYETQDVPFVDLITGSIVNYAAQNQHLHKIGLSKIDNFSNDLFDNDQVDKYAAKISQFPMLSPFVGYWETAFLDSLPKDLIKFCTQFDQLEQMAISCELNVLYSTIAALEPLKCLVYLNLTIQWGDTDKEYFEEEGLYEDQNGYRVYNQTMPLQNQLCSVKILYLQMDVTTDNLHADLHSLKLSRIFPNLEVLYLEDKSFVCLACQPEDNNEEAKNACNRLSLLPFKECEQLHSVYSSKYYEVKQWSMEEL